MFINVYLPFYKLLITLFTCINHNLIPGVRDYINVVDLAKGHVLALKQLKDNCGLKVDSLVFYLKGLRATLCYSDLTDCVTKMYSKVSHIKRSLSYT